MTKKKIFFLLTFIIGIFFLLVNILSSQTVYPLFFSLVNQPKKREAILFLRKIKGTKEFPNQLAYFKKIYGKEIEKEVFAEEIKRKEEIKKFETLLQKNKKARDILLKLAGLYFEDGNFKKAKDYYLKAKEVDPQIKVEGLEKIR